MFFAFLVLTAFNASTMRITVKLGINIILMIDLIKLNMVSQCYKDGMVIGTKDEEAAKLSSREKHYAIKDRPSFAQHLNYFCFCGSALIGPAVEFRDFDDMINVRAPYSQMKLFSNFPYAIFRFVMGILLAVVVKPFL